MSTLLNEIFEPVDQILRVKFTIKAKDLTGRLKAVSSILSRCPVDSDPNANPLAQMNLLAQDSLAWSNDLFEWISFDPAGNSHTSIDFEDILFLQIWTDCCEEVYQELASVTCEGNRITFSLRKDADFTAHNLSSVSFFHNSMTENQVRAISTIGMVLAKGDILAAPALFQDSNVQACLTDVLYPNASDWLLDLQRYWLVTSCLAAAQIPWGNGPVKAIQSAEYQRIPKRLLAKCIKACFPDFTAFEECENLLLTPIMGLPRNYRWCLAIHDDGYLYHSPFTQHMKIDLIEYLTAILSPQFERGDAAKLRQLDADKEIIWLEEIKQLVPEKWTVYPKRGFTCNGVKGDIDFAFWDGTCLLLFEAKWNHMGNRWVELLRVQKEVLHGREQIAKSIPCLSEIAANYGHAGCKCELAVISRSTLGVTTPLNDIEIMVLNHPLLREFMAVGKPLLSLRGWLSKKYRQVAGIEFKQLEFQRYGYTFSMPVADADFKRFGKRLTTMG